MRIDRSMSRFLVCTIQNFKLENEIFNFFNLKFWIWRTKNWSSVGAKPSLLTLMIQVIPRSFHQFLPQASVPVVFSCRNKTWKMRYSGQLALKRINTGWRQFAVDNNLKVGDGCVYELMDSENLRFRVQILRGEVPPPSAYEVAGRSSSNPVIIG